MIVAGYALVALIVLMSLLYVPIAADIRPLAGPDSMALAGPFFLSVGRWILLAVVLVLAASRGGFSWIHRSAGVQALAVLVLLACVAGLELWSIVSATSGWYGKPARIWVAAFAVVAPLVLAYFAAVALRGPSHAPPAGSLRLVAGGLVALMCLGTAVLGAHNARASREARAASAEREAEDRRAMEEKLTSFRALSPGSPLRDWLPWTQDPVDEIRDEAVESIRARPRRNAELAEILESEDPLPALRFLWLWTPDPPAELAKPFLDAVRGLPDWSRALLDDSDPANDSEVDTACEASVVLADAFRSSGLDFRAPIERLLAFLESRALPEEQMSYDAAYRGRSMLRTWLDSHSAAGLAGR